LLDVIIIYILLRVFYIHIVSIFTGHEHRRTHTHAMLRLPGLRGALQRGIAVRPYTILGTVDPFAQNKPKKYKKKNRNTTPAYRFIDRTRVKVQGGNGGKGSLSFCHVGRSYKKKPDGGHGGDGGSVIIIADKKEQTLRWSQAHQFAEDGVRGASAEMAGRAGKNLILRVPCGTIVRRVLDHDEEWDEQNWVVRKVAGANRGTTGGEFVFHHDGGVEYVHHYDDEFEDVNLFEDGAYEKRKADTSRLGIRGDVNPDDSSSDPDNSSDDDNEDYEVIRVDSAGHRVLGEIDPNNDSMSDEDYDSDNTDSDDDDEDYDVIRVDSYGHRVLAEIDPGDSMSDSEATDSDDHDEDFEMVRVDSSGHRVLDEVDPDDSMSEGDSDSDESDDEDLHVLSVDSAGHRILGYVNPGDDAMYSDSDSDSDNGLVDTRERQQVLLADLDQPGAYVIVARGGRGGVGNSVFASRHGAIPPEEMIRKSKPSQGEVAFLQLELKMIADIGLVGFPNAGKSSLLAAMSKAMPEIAPYPFTTLNPLVGVIEYRDGYKVMAADVPGLVAGASMGKGKGHDFLRHLERTKALLYIVDSAGTDGRNPLVDLRVLVNELGAYGDGDMLTRPALVVANKLDLLSQEESEEFTFELGCIAEELGLRFDGNVFGISAGVTGEGLGSLSRAIRNVVSEGEIERESFFQQETGRMH
jgi:Obg family GTPase CgtA